jgi:superfamily II DNA or RNA helicase
MDRRRPTGRKGTLPALASHALALEWHPTLNTDPTPGSLTIGSGKKVWWQCAIDSTHEWAAKINSRSSGAGCPFCTGLRVTVENSLATTHPSLATEWNTERNGELTALDVSAGSGRSVWWCCSTERQHEWKARVGGRVLGSGCPFCSNKKVSKENCLESTHPHIAAGWHTSLNSPLTPSDITAGSAKTVWWQCDLDASHSFRASVVTRVNKSICPKCPRPGPGTLGPLVSVRPDLAAEWHASLNTPLTPSDVTAGSGKVVWWQCSADADHVYQTSVGKRYRGAGCIYCASGNRKVTPANALASTHPELAGEWHLTLNGAVSPFDVSAGSGKKYWWVCRDSHEWQAAVVNRTRGSGCPYCSGSRASQAHNLATACPEIMSEWHPVKNGTRLPTELTPGSNLIVWWKCAAGHEWQAKVRFRARGGSGCPLCSGVWSQTALKMFVASLREHLHVLTQAELYAICQQNGLIGSIQGEFAERLATGRLSSEQLASLLDDDWVEDTNTLANNRAASCDVELRDFSADDIVSNPDSADAGSFVQEEQLPVVVVNGVLEAAAVVLASADEETAEFLIASSAAKLWKQAYRDPLAVEQATAMALGDEFQERVRRAFREEFDASTALRTPAGWSFELGGKPRQPNLMQQHVAVQVRDKLRVGNWSGTGAGKTISAVLASRVVASELTVVVCPNNTVDGWCKTILECFPDTRIATKDLDPKWSIGQEPRYLILNYESLQAADSGEKLRKLVASEQIDMVVIDEVHYAKQRSAESESRRRKNLLELVTTAGYGNHDLRVLAMSATPVVNNLFEARSLLELIEGVELDELDVRATTSNAMAIHQYLVRRGTRWMPDYPTAVSLITDPIDCSDLVDEVRALGRHPHPAEIERILLAAKLPSIIEACRKGKTLIYTEYVDGIVGKIRDALEAEGLRVGVFTGDDKTGLEKFIGHRFNVQSGQPTKLPKEDQVDVLIGSSAIGTGVDGLQHVCDRLVFATLPWTAAGYQQVVGRIHRQGQTASKIDVVVPVTSAEVGEEVWSWCKTRMDRINFKRSLADAAVDGVVPEYRIVDPHKAATAAAAWLARLTGGHTGTADENL